MSKKFPPITWYQRKDTVSVTINVLDSTDLSVNIESVDSTSLLKVAVTSGSGDKQSYAADIKLFAAVEPALSKHEIRARGVVFLSLRKRATASNDPDDWFWPRLVLEKAKANPSLIKPDLANWQDADEIVKRGNSNSAAAASAGGDYDDDDDDDDGIPMSRGRDVGGMSLEHEEVQRTLAALREEQARLQRELASSAEEEQKVLASLTSEQKVLEESAALLSANKMTLEGKRDMMREACNKVDEDLAQAKQAADAAAASAVAGSDDDDELPPLVN